LREIITVHPTATLRWLIILSTERYNKITTFHHNHHHCRCCGFYGIRTKKKSIWYLTKWIFYKHRQNALL